MAAHVKGRRKREKKDWVEERDLREGKVVSNFSNTFRSRMAKGLGDLRGQNFLQLLGDSEPHW